MLQLGTGEPEAARPLAELGERMGWLCYHPPTHSDTHTPAQGLAEPPCPAGVSGEGDKPDKVGQLKAAAGRGVVTEHNIIT